MAEAMVSMLSEGAHCAQGCCDDAKEGIVVEEDANDDEEKGEEEPVPVKKRCYE